jgi:hypothetical protein
VFEYIGASTSGLALFWVKAGSREGPKPIKISGLSEISEMSKMSETSEMCVNSEMRELSKMSEMIGKKIKR